MKTLSMLACLPLLLVLPAAAAVPAATGERERGATEAPAAIFGAAAGPAAKAVTDTVVLMGPGGLYPFRGDFETASPRPGGDGLLTDGWTSHDLTASENHWHVADYDSPGSGQGAWCGKLTLSACDAGDVDGGYGNNWQDVLEFRKTVTGDATVRVQAALRHDTEPGYDFLTLQRRTAAHPDFEPVAAGQGQSWDGAGTVTVDRTFSAPG